MRLLRNGAFGCAGERVEGLGEEDGELKKLVVRRLVVVERFVSPSSEDVGREGLAEGCSCSVDSAKAMSVTSR